MSLGWTEASAVRRNQARSVLAFSQDGWLCRSSERCEEVPVMLEVWKEISWLTRQKDKTLIHPREEHRKLVCGLKIPGDSFGLITLPCILCPIHYQPPPLPHLHCRPDRSEEMNIANWPWRWVEGYSKTSPRPFRLPLSCIKLASERSFRDVWL